MQIYSYVHLSSSPIALLPTEAVENIECLESCVFLYSAVEALLKHIQVLNRAKRTSKLLYDRCFIKKIELLLMNNHQQSQPANL